MKITQKAISALGILCLALMACNLSSLLGSDPSTTPTISEGSTSLSLSGTVWHDLCALPVGSSLPDPLPIGCTPNGLGGARANGIWEADEPGISEVTVVLYVNDCNGEPVNSTITDANGTYTFNGLSPLKYCIIVDSLSSPNDKILIPGEWTSPSSTSYFTIYSVDLLFESKVLPINFGWDYQFLPEYLPNAGANTTPPITSISQPSATVAPVVPVAPIATVASSGGDTTPPTFGEVTTLEADVYYGNAGACGSSGTITIEAYINDASGINSAYVKYRYLSSGWTGDYHTVNFSYQAGTGLTGFTIPAGEAVFELVTDDGYIQYFVYATDTAGNTAIYPAGAGAPVAIPIYFCP